MKIACALCSDSEAKKEEEKPKEDQHRPGFGRGYFAAANDSIGASGDAANSSKPDDKAPAKVPAAEVSAAPATPVRSGNLLNGMPGSTTVISAHLPSRNTLAGSHA